MPAGDIKRAIAGVWVGGILHPAMCFALADGACFLQYRDGPAA
jgi:hypothetical protein